jgi:hypothetical protein
MQISASAATLLPHVGQVNIKPHLGYELGNLCAVFSLIRDERFAFDGLWIWRLTIPTCSSRGRSKTSVIRNRTIVDGGKPPNFDISVSNR